MLQPLSQSNFVQFENKTKGTLVHKRGLTLLVGVDAFKFMFYALLTSIAHEPRPQALLTRTQKPLILIRKIIAMT